MLSGAVFGGGAQAAVSSSLYPATDLFFAVTSEAANDAGTTISNTRGLVAPVYYHGYGHPTMPYGSWFVPKQDDSSVNLNPYRAYTDPYNLGTVYVQIYAGAGTRWPVQVFDMAGNFKGTLPTATIYEGHNGMEGLYFFAPNGTLYVNANGGVLQFDILDGFTFIGTANINYGEPFGNPTDNFLYIRNGTDVWRYYLEDLTLYDSFTVPYNAHIFPYNRVLLQPVNGQATLHYVLLDGGTTFDMGTTCYSSALAVTFMNGYTFCAAGGNQERFAMGGGGNAAQDQYLTAFNSNGQYYSVWPAYSGTLVH